MRDQSLELRNASSLMKQEHGYGLETMGAQYQFQNKFADNQNKRDLVMLGASGDESRKNIGATGAQERLSLVTAGEQARENTKTSGEQERLSLVTAGEQQRLNIGTSGAEQRATDTNRIRTTGDEQRQTIDFEDQIEGRKENRQAARSRTMARSF